MNFPYVNSKRRAPRETRAFLLIIRTTYNANCSVISLNRLHLLGKKSREVKYEIYSFVNFISVKI